MNLQEQISRMEKMMGLSEGMVQSTAWKQVKKTIDILSKKQKVLLLSCSNRYNWDKNNIDVPKSKLLATYIHEELGNKSTLIDVTDLKIFPCEGNVSRKDGNGCGVMKAKLKDKDKNPSGEHRCWVNINQKSDELWKISKELLESDAVIFFSSIRWGQTNMYYQNLIERLTWLENRHSTLGESNIIKDIESGFICVGHNWNGETVNETQMKVHEFYGFKINKDLYWNWQYIKDYKEESLESYKNSHDKFIKDTRI